MVQLSLTLGKRLHGDQIEVLGAVPITRRVKNRVPELKNPAMTGDGVKMLQAVLRSIGMSQKDDPGYLGVPVEITGKFGSTADISCTNRALGRLEYIDEVIIKKFAHPPTNTPETVRYQVAAYRMRDNQMKLVNTIEGTYQQTSETLYTVIQQRHDQSEAPIPLLLNFLEQKAPQSLYQEREWFDWWK